MRTATTPPLPTPEPRRYAPRGSVQAMCFTGDLASVEGIVRWTGWGATLALGYDPLTGLAEEPVLVFNPPYQATFRIPVGYYLVDTTPPHSGPPSYRVMDPVSFAATYERTP